MKAKLCVLVASVLLTGCFDRATTTSNVSGAAVGPQITELVPGAKGFASLQWSANPGEQDGFYIEGSSDNVSFVTVASVPDGTTQATIHSLADGTTYYFRVRGYNATGSGAATAVVLATTPAPTPSPSP